ncbi:unnamed protein product [Lactuca virosa]|uniref:Mediator of RNA polymerase II transcription subunit 32 n=1 Tax=Lactuca virosa TaxID=75947 RepID=A0AAU9PJG2_9ASTR|nr:unnamed protein product [Lactuca virosa]
MVRSSPSQDKKYSCHLKYNSGLPSQCTIVNFFSKVKLISPILYFLTSKIQSMDNIVDALNNAYLEFVGAIANTLETKDAANGQVTAATDAALENLKQRWELFRVSCDQAEEFVESVKLRIGSECLVDEATGSVAGKPGQPVTPGLPPISAVRLEQMSKAVRWLVIELQQGSGSGGNLGIPQHNSAPFDARFHEDSTQ